MAGFYEIAARHADGRAYLIAYSPRVSRRGLWDAIDKRTSHLLRVLQVDGSKNVTTQSKPRPHIVLDGWEIGFTGRTMHAATTHGPEHPYIGDAQPGEPASRRDG